MKKILLITLFFFSANVFSQSEWATLVFTAWEKQQQREMRASFIYSTSEPPIKPSKVTNSGFSVFPNMNSVLFIKEMETKGWKLVETDMAFSSVSEIITKLYFKKEE